MSEVINNEEAIVEEMTANENLDGEIQDIEFEMAEELSDEDLGEVTGGTRVVRASDDLTEAAYVNWCNYFNSGSGYVLYNGRKLRVTHWTGSHYKKGGGYFKKFKLVFPDGSKRVVQADNCQLVTK